MAHCQSCGGTLRPDAEFCTACGMRRGDGPAASRLGRDTGPSPALRPAWVSFLTVFHWILFAVIGLAAVAALFIGILGVRFPWWLTLALAFQAAFCLFTAVGLGRLKSFGRTLMQVEAFALLLVIPLGTLAGLEIIRRLNAPEARRLFGGRSVRAQAPGEPAAPLPTSRAAPDDFSFATRLLFVLASAVLFSSLIFSGIFFLHEMPESDPWIARVGKQAISFKDYQIQLGRMMLSWRNVYSVDEATMFQKLRVHNLVLDMMINRRLLLNAAKDHKVKVTPQEVRKKVMQDFPMFQKDGRFIGKEEYGRVLALQRMTISEFEKSVEEQIKFERLIERLAGDKSSDEKEAFLRDLVAELRKTTEIQVDLELLESIPSRFGN